ncbi:MAG TPA: hypothetical protein DIU05_09335, partial [Bacteroidetes bacterium]|nr:hypothetical protein [Bacteroidota bacterium]
MIEIVVYSVLMVLLFLYLVGSSSKSNFSKLFLLFFLVFYGPSYIIFHAKDYSDDSVIVLSQLMCIASAGFLFANASVSNLILKSSKTQSDYLLWIKREEEPVYI